MRVAIPLSCGWNGREFKEHLIYDFSVKLSFSYLVTFEKQSWRENYILSLRYSWNSVRLRFTSNYFYRNHRCYCFLGTVNIEWRRTFGAVRRWCIYRSIAIGKRKWDKSFSPVRLRNPFRLLGPLYCTHSVLFTT